MSRIVSTRLPSVHSATSAPSHRKMPVRAPITSRIGSASVRDTVGGMIEKIASIAASPPALPPNRLRSEEHTSELQSLMRISYAVFCLKKKKQHRQIDSTNNQIKQ